jgi:hypothetical protein
LQPRLLMIASLFSEARAAVHPVLGVAAWWQVAVSCSAASLSSEAPAPAIAASLKGPGRLRQAQGAAVLVVAARVPGHRFVVETPLSEYVSHAGCGRAVLAAFDRAGGSIAEQSWQAHNRQGSAQLLGAGHGAYRPRLPNKEMKLTKPGQNGASQLISSVRQT